MNLDMCDANVQKHQLTKISQLFNIVLKSKHDILQVIVRKLRFINQKSVNLCEKE